MLKNLDPDLAKFFPDFDRDLAQAAAQPSPSLGKTEGRR